MRGMGGRIGGNGLRGELEVELLASGSWKRWGWCWGWLVGEKKSWKCWGLVGEV